jgi:hypothetical protein
MRRRRVEDDLLSMPSLPREEGGRFLPLSSLLYPEKKEGGYCPSPSLP